MRRHTRTRCRALLAVLEKGRAGQTYAIGGDAERTNLQIVRTLCALLDDLSPRADGKPYAEQITFVADRPGHDRRYAIDASKIERDLHWRPEHTFDRGMRATVAWYLSNQEWVENVLSGKYRMERLGTGASVRES